MKTYFPGLNALRFYAALSVAIRHIWSYSGSFVPSTQVRTIVNFFTLSGEDAVTLFFVLSGFLITYLLIDEKAHTQTVRVKRFYGRRARRILPLYALTVIVTLLLMPRFIPVYGFGMNAFSLATIILLSGHVGSAFGDLGYMGHFWSLGCEEWFYAVLPPLVKRFRIPLLVLAVIGLRLLVALLVNPRLLFFSNVYDPLSHFIQLTRFDCMAIGAIGAWLVFNHHPLLRWVYRCEVLAWLIAIFLIIIPISDFGGMLYDMAAALVFMVIVVSVATKPHPVIRLEHPILKRLGVYTYGMYMVHPLVIFLVAPLMPGSVWLCVVIPILTLMVAIGTYRFIETPFLRTHPSAAQVVLPVSTSLHLQAQSDIQKQE